MSADETPTTDLEDEAVEDDVVAPDPDELVWIVHPEVAVPGRQTRRHLQVVEAEAGWREATGDEAAAFDAQAVAGLRPTVDGEGLAVDPEAGVIDPVVAGLLTRPVLVIDPEAEKPAPKPKSRPRAAKH